MNNRYLYRAKRIDNGEWITGYLLVKKKDFYICEKPYECMDEYSSLNGQSYGFGGFKFVYPSTICQCTGLKDKNGKMIWENDILNSGNLVVTWREELASYCLTKKGWMYQHFFGEAVDACDCEVIGNIFDNPELLEVGE